MRGERNGPDFLTDENEERDMKRRVKKEIAIRFMVFAVAILITVENISAQRWGISTNALEYANFITLNAEAAAAVGKHWSIHINGKYNPFIFNTKGSPTEQLMNKSLTAAVGGRYWPFFVYSGFYYGFKAQWSQFSRGGITSRRSSEGDAFGLGISFGYSLIVSRHFNIEFGVGLWGGNAFYTTYSCPECGEILKRGSKWFVYPNDIVINLLFTF